MGEQPRMAKHPGFHQMKGRDGRFDRENRFMIQILHKQRIDKERVIAEWVLAN